MTLVGYWPLDESSGDALDYSGNENHGTVNGATQGYTSTTLLGNSVYDFNDSNNEDVNIGSVNYVAGSNQVSICSWFKADDINQSGVHRIFGRHSTSANDNWALWLNQGVLEFYVDTGSNADAGTISPNTGQIYFVVGVYDGSSAKLYINGEEQDSVSQSGTIANTSAPVTIGSRQSTEHFFDGQISNVRLYNHALTPHEIQYLYEVSQTGQMTSSVKTL
jgi:hypothetical protein